MSRVTAVVFVHGIGAQRKGATLTEWAEPLVRAIDTRAQAATSGNGIEVLSSTLGTESDSVWIQLPAIEPKTQRSVVFLEARWSESFIELRSGLVLSWGMRFVYRATGRAITQVFRLIAAYGSRFGWLVHLAFADSTSIAWRLIALIWVLLLLGPMVILGACAVLTGALFVMVPLIACLALAVIALLSWVPVLGRYLRRVTAALVSTIGDSAAWTTAPVRAEAMRDQVRRDIRRARTIATRVIVVAHSQGAAVSARAIFQGPGATPVNTLITVGGANSLLQDPGGAAGSSSKSVVQEWARGRVRWVNLWSSLDPVPAGPVGVTEDDQAARWLEMTKGAQVAGQAALERLNLGWRSILLDATEEQAEQYAKVYQTQMRAMSSALTTPRGPAEVMVDNRLSLFRDHTTYTQNAQVIDRVCDEILQEDTHKDVPIGILRTRAYWLGLAFILKFLAAPLALLLSPKIITAFGLDELVGETVERAGGFGGLWIYLEGVIASSQAIGLITFWLVALALVGVCFITTTWLWQLYWNSAQGWKRNGSLVLFLAWGVSLMTGLALLITAPQSLLEMPPLLALFLWPWTGLFLVPALRMPVMPIEERR